MKLIEKAISIALEKHSGQTDNNGKPYILHVLRVMLAMDTEDEMTAGVMHDVIEDSDYTLDNMEEDGFPEHIINAVDAISRREGESYEDFFNRAVQDPIAKKIKKADLEDKMRLKEYDKLSEKDLEKLNKYIKYWHKIIKL